MAGVQSKDGDRLVALQALRAVAATMVVLAHTQGFVQLYAETHGQVFAGFTLFPLSTGVDLFFLISGFVIVFASQKLFATTNGWREFIRRRLIRIVPMYWMTLTLRLLVLAVGASAGAKAFPGLAAIVTSYFFVPYDGMGFGPAYPFPIVDLGWTLNYEMFFYVLFACAIALPRTRAVMFVAVVLAGGVVLANIFQPEDVALRFWFRPITWEFAFGAMTALLFLRGVVLPPVVRIAMLFLALLIWSVPISWFGETSEPGFYDWTRLGIWGTGAALIVAAAALGPMRFHAWWSQALVKLGDSSYVLYLLHPFVFLLVKAVLARMSVPPLFYWPVVVATVALAISVAVVFHTYVETPVISWLRRITSGKSAFARQTGKARQVAPLGRITGEASIAVKAQSNRPQ